MRFLLDEDLPHEIAGIARGIGLDVQSVHELRRLGISDDKQLRLAAGSGHIFVTRNRNHFLAATLDFYRRVEAHAGVLIVPRRLPNTRPAAIARALERWTHEHGKEPHDAMMYRIDFLS